MKRNHQDVTLKMKEYHDVMMRVREQPERGRKTRIKGEVKVKVKVKESESVERFAHRVS